MKKMRFSLSKIMCGITLLMSGTVIGQYNVIPIGPIIIPPAAVTTGYTHATTILDDCTSGNANIEANFAMNLATFGGNGTYRVAIKLYKGDWAISGMGMTVTNEAYVTTIYSTGKVFPAIFIPIGGTYPMTTATFFSTPPSPSIIVTKNGTYRMTTTLQRKINVVTWSDIYTTPLSSVYLTLDLPPYTTFGDLAEVAHVENLKIASNFSFNINGITNYTNPIVTCAQSPLILKNVINWYGNPGNATLTLEKGIINLGVFYPGILPGDISSIIFPVTGADLDLTALFSLTGLSGSYRVTYKLPDDDCNGILTPVTKSIIFTANTPAFTGNYDAFVAIVSGCNLTNNKATSPTPLITAVMPSNTYLPTFKCEIANAIGWEGAFSVGITGFSFLNNYSVDVYEVNSSGVRGSAPSIYRFSGVGSPAGTLSFNGSESARYDASYPYSIDPAYPADPTGNGWGNYFSEMYAASFPSGLTAMSAKIFCVDVSQTPASGCVVNKTSYFRIANNGQLNGKLARIGVSGTEDANQTNLSLEIYPNPTQGELNIPISDEDTNVNMIIIDNLGKQVLNITDVKAKHGKVNIENLTAGIYFYSINKDNSLYRGKIVKQ